MVVVLTQLEATFLDPIVVKSLFDQSFWVKNRLLDAKMHMC